MCAGNDSRNSNSERRREKENQKMVIDRVNGKIPILLGVGGNNTRAIVETLKMMISPEWMPSYPWFLTITSPHRKESINIIRQLQALQSFQLYCIMFPVGQGLI